MENHTYYQHILTDYSSICVKRFKDRFIHPDDLDMYLKTNVFSKYHNQIIGHSENNRPIRVIDIGHGSTKILIWSQMHGNESTTTKALLDFIKYLDLNNSNPSVQQLLKACHIKIIPMLNPDGASQYTRVNANDIDLNRDALDESQKETQVFFDTFNKFKPDFCFNMHGQRSIYSAGTDEFPATVSFLAPSVDKKLSINDTRIKAMQLIVSANKVLQELIPQQVGRYDDAHNPNCFGDFIQKLGVPTVLFEAGHYQNDYKRNVTRKYVMVSLLKILDDISSNTYQNHNYNTYFNIPMNEKLYMDCIVKNVKNTDSGYIGIQFKECLVENTIVFKPFINSLKNLSHFYAHRYIDSKLAEVTVNNSNELKKGTIIEKIKIKNANIRLL